MIANVRRFSISFFRSATGFFPPKYKFQRNVHRMYTIIPYHKKCGKRKIPPHVLAFYSLSYLLLRERLGESPAVPVFKLSRNFVSPTSCVLTSQNTSRPKVPVRKLSPSGSIQTEVHAPSLDEIAARFLLDARCRATETLWRTALSTVFEQRLCRCSFLFWQDSACRNVFSTAYSSRRPSRARVSVTSSTNSRCPPTGMP